MKLPNLPFKLPFGRPRSEAPRISVISDDLRFLNRTILNALQSAELKTGSSKKNATNLIQSMRAFTNLCRTGIARWQSRQVVDVVAREGLSPEQAPPEHTLPASVAAATGSPRPPGTTVNGSHTCQAGTRSYKLYVPARTGKELMPLVVMLHGCTQSPDDFAAGTRMNEMAERYGFLVAYPEQATNANGSKCWNWYRAQDQSRDTGEPSLIAGITRDIVRTWPVDMKRVFVAGLSAGGAMAVILGRTYPDMYAAVGVHSGLAYGVAHDVPSAFTAMKTNPENPVFTPTPTSMLLVPTIVFHGDCDAMVNAGNGAHVVAQTLAQAQLGQTGRAVLQATEYAGSASGGRRYTRTVYRDKAGRPLVEQWLVHGAGHAWAGGSDFGSFTDPEGPDATEAMIHFFLSQDDADFRGHPQ